ncbi:MAG: penicillin epimerase, partial [Acidimicrobiia bacterium]
LFDWTGTDDASPWFAVPDAIRVVESMEPGGWPAVMKRNHELVLKARQLVCDCLGQDPPAPDELVGSMATVELPDSKDPISKDLLSPLNQRLLDAGFETLALMWPVWPKQVVRISAHLYNDLDEYEAFARTLRTLVG